MTCGWLGAILFLWIFPERVLSVIFMGTFLLIWAPLGLVPWWFHLQIILVYMTIYFPKWNYARTCFIWKWIRTQFYHIEYIDPYNIIEEEMSERGPLTVYAMGPHGVFGEGAHIGISLDERFVNTSLIGSSVMTWIPFVKDICGLVGMVPANKICMKHELITKRNNILLVPEGIRGFLLEDTPELIPERLGFIECAVESGARIVPVYTKNIKILYTRWIPGQWFRRVQHWMLSTRLRYCITFSWGAWLGVFPYAQPVVTVFGEPILVPRTGTKDEKIRKMADEYKRVITKMRK